MTLLHEAQEPTPGLRERKKARTRASIQQHAMRLFAQQGYTATTVEQIAEAAEVSPSTFFRYYPTKEDVVLSDDYNPMLVAAVQAQPAELSALQAIRASMRALRDAVPPEEIQLIRDRSALVFAEPELRAAMLRQFTDTVRTLAQAVALRVGRPADDFAVRTLAGAVIGVSMSALLAALDDPKADYLELIDIGLGRLENGLQL